MDFTIFTNADKLQEIEANLQSIHPSLYIGEVKSCKNEARRVVTTFKECGNMDIIDKLIENGWSKCRGFRDNGSRYIVMQKDL